MSDFKNMISIIESAENGLNVKNKTKYRYRFDESMDSWIVENEHGTIHGNYPTKAEARKVKRLCESDDDDTEEQVTYENFWDAFQVDEDFIIHESNETYCVLGDKTEFHYGTHVSEDIAEKHVESLKDFK